MTIPKKSHVVCNNFALSIEQVIEKHEKKNPDTLDTIQTMPHIFHPLQSKQSLAKSYESFIPPSRKDYGHT